MTSSDDERKLSRTPPVEVLRELRREVGFGCPVPGCSNPFLTWHHFDPPWHIRQHHDAEGMIALCREHHDKADAGAYTTEQLRRLKRTDPLRTRPVSSDFAWMRRKLLVVVGGNFYYETAIPVKIGDHPIVWFHRDEDGYLLLNVQMVSTLPEPRMFVHDHFWISAGTPIDLECPPSGRLVHAKYQNGDELRVEFFPLDSLQDVKKKYPGTRPSEWKGMELPITAVEIRLEVGGTGISFGPRETRIPGVTMRNAFMAGGQVGLQIG